MGSGGLSAVLASWCKWHFYWRACLISERQEDLLLWSFRPFSSVCEAGCFSPIGSSLSPATSTLKNVGSSES